MAPTRISVARLLQLRIPIAWQEAVEVARAADALSAVRGLRVTLQDCSISTDGSVELATDGSDRIGAPLSGLQLLRALLEGQSAPAELLAIVATADDALLSFPSEQGGQAAPSAGLDRFARPNPAVEIARLAARASVAERAYAPPVAPDRVPTADASHAVPPEPAAALPEWASAVPSAPTELERLRSQVQQLAPPEWRRRIIAWVAQARWALEDFPSRRVLAVIGVIAATSGLGIAAWVLVPSGAKPSTAAGVVAPESVISSDAVAATPEAVAADAGAAEEAAAPADTAETAGAPAPPQPAIIPSSSTPGSATGAVSRPSSLPASPSRGPAAASDRAVQASRAPAPAPARAQPTREAPARFVEDAGQPAPRTRTPSTIALPPAPEFASSPAPERASTTRAEDARLEERTARLNTRERFVYSDQDLDVEPPIPVRPQLPSEPKADSEAGDSFIEVMVDERGQVLQVRLHSSDLSFNDRMIVAAAKAWQFYPALKDGRPVRYRLRVPVTR